MSAATGLIEQLRDQATSRLSDQKNQAATTLASIVEAVRHTGKQLGEKNATLGQYAETTAAELERWSSQLKERNVSQLLDDAKHFARRRPAVFLGISAAAGLLAARFLKSSSADEREGGSRVPSSAYSGYPAPPQNPYAFYPPNRSAAPNRPYSAGGVTEPGSSKSTGGVSSTPKRQA